ncbi:UNVERIFIED_CONTAM: hypothetical protein DES50_111112 [Williamsia faeni]
MTFTVVGHGTILLVNGLSPITSTSNVAGSSTAFGESAYGTLLHEALHPGTSTSAKYLDAIDGGDHRYAPDALARLRTMHSQCHASRNRAVLTQ